MKSNLKSLSSTFSCLLFRYSTHSLLYRILIADAAVFLRWGWAVYVLHLYGVLVELLGSCVLVDFIDGNSIVAA